MQNLRPDLKSLNKRGAPKCSQNSPNLLHLFCSISQKPELGFKNHRRVLHKQNEHCFFKIHPITFYTANFYHSTNLVWYKGLGVSCFAAFLMSDSILPLYLEMFSDSSLNSVYWVVGAKYRFTQLASDLTQMSSSSVDWSILSAPTPWLSWWL